MTTLAHGLAGYQQGQIAGDLANNGVDLTARSPRNDMGGKPDWLCRAQAGARLRSRPL